MLPSIRLVGDTLGESTVVLLGESVCSGGTVGCVDGEGLDTEDGPR